MDFNFLTNPQPDQTTQQQEYVGPNIKSAVKMTPRMFASSVLEVFEKLGGASWLLLEAEADPKAFLALLSKMIPKSVQLDDLAGIAVTVIDQFGKQVKVEAQGQPNPLPEPQPLAATKPSEGRMESGQLQIATGGSPSPPDNKSSCQGETPTQPAQPDIDIIDIF